MSALSDLQAAQDALKGSVAANTAAIDAAIAKIGQPSGVPEADVQAAADVVKALSDTVSADAARLAAA